MLNDNDHDIHVLNTLTTTTIDSAHGFERAAEDADVARFSTLFREFAAERRAMVAKLQAEVRRLGGNPEDDGSLKADIHRRWVDLRAAISASGDKGVIDEVERGEDYIKAKYGIALKDDKLAPATRAVIEEAYTSVLAGHDRASALKHSMQAV